MLSIRDNRLTYSQIACMRDCERKHYLRYVVGMTKERDALPLRIGKAVHVALQMRGLGETIQDSISKGLEKYRDSLPEAMIIDEEERYKEKINEVIIDCLLTGYFWRWEDMDKDIEIVANEQQFELPIWNPETGAKSRTFVIAGKIDNIVRLGDGRLALREYKTSGSDIADDADYWKRLTIDTQLSIYYIAALELGFEIQTVLYDVIRKPEIRPCLIPVLDADGLKQVFSNDTGERATNKDGSWRQSADAKAGLRMLTDKETPEQFKTRLMKDIYERYEFYFNRRIVSRLEMDLEETKYELWQRAAMIRDCNKFERWPRNDKQCDVFGKCEYFDLCTTGFNVQGFDPATSLPDGFIINDSVHRELDED